MKNIKEISETLTLFRNMLANEVPRSITADVEGGAASAETAVTEPHPYYVVSGQDVLEGMLSEKAELKGYQSLVYEGDRPVEAPIAAYGQNQMEYAAAWPADASLALQEAIRVAEADGRDAGEFAVINVPEVGFTAVWLQQSNEFVPLDLARTRGSLDPSSIYAESDVIKWLHDPLAERLAPEGGAGSREAVPTKPPIA